MKKKKFDIEQMQLTSVWVTDWAGELHSRMQK